MNNRKLIQKVLGHKSEPKLNTKVTIPSSKWLPESNNNTLRKAKGFPSATTIWSNSIYNFNKNYLKNIPAVDNIVNKIIRSFFTINALANNSKGLKSRLVQRRYKRLSLNRILVSKPQVKHTNDKVFITVYLFNKKKRSLLLKLKNLYNTLSFKKSFTYFTLPLNKNIEFKVKGKKLTTSLIQGVSKRGGNISSKPQSEYALWRKYKNIISFKNKDVTCSNKSQIIDYKLKNVITHKDRTSKKNSKSLNEAFINKYSFVQVVSGSTKKTKQKFLFTKTYKQTDDTSFLNNVSYYKNLNNLTQHNIRTFMYTLQNSFGVSGCHIVNSNLNNVNKHLGIDLKRFFKDITKYKLYSNNLNFKNTINKSDISAMQLKNPNYSIYKLKSAYKLFTLYNNITLGNGSWSETYSKKLLLNSYKLLKKSYSNLSIEKGPHQTELNSLSLGVSNFSINSITTLKDNKINSGIALKKKINILNSISYKNSKSYVNLKKTMKSIILINKLNRIDRFFSKYRDILLQNNSKTIGKAGLENQVSSQIISTYKIGFINELLERELLYIYYLKLLYYNNALFKNWFLYSLKTLLSKIYNKKVVLNLINLKYIHLNSDIFSEAVNIRLRNFKKNRVVKVLKKAIKLVPISKVNIYTCDEHSSTYKYVHNFYNKFIHLKLDIFKELGLNDTPESSFTKNNKKGYCSVKRLNHIQASTINFIRYKSVFGVRLEAAGRLTKRSTASRSLFKFRYNGTLRNNTIVNNSISSVILKDNRISNLQFTHITSKTRNGSFGLKGWINSN